MYHYRKTRLRYTKFPVNETCDFCDPENRHSRVLEQTKYSYVIPNRTFYDIWELRRVIDHLLLIPNRHVLQLKELNDAEQADIIKQMAKYESLGYEVYARSQDNITRSVGHQHTHLIKTDKQLKRGLFYLRKPYFLIRF